MGFISDRGCLDVGNRSGLEMYRGGQKNQFVSASHDNHMSWK